jgi:hypothetical protein
VKTGQKNPVLSCTVSAFHPTVFVLFRKKWEWDGNGNDMTETGSKTGEVFSVRISGNPFWAGIVPYFILFLNKTGISAHGP